MTERIALYDMDGTLADYDKVLDARLREMLSPTEIKAIEAAGFDPAKIPMISPEASRQPFMEARKTAITNNADFWRGLPRFQLGFDLWEVTHEIGFKHMIATRGPRSKSAAWQGKVDWVDRELGTDTPITVTTDKSLLYGAVLVDDFPKYATGWLAHRPRGLVVMPAHPWNKDFYHPQAIRYDGTNMPEVRWKLQAAYDRITGDTDENT